MGPWFQTSRVYPTEVELETRVRKDKLPVEIERLVTVIRASVGSWSRANLDATRTSRRPSVCDVH